jgi:hypothetical protein
MTKIFHGTILLALLLSLCGNANAQSAQDAVADRLPNIERLLTQSSGAKQVLNSNNSEALAKRQQALDAYQQAREKIEQGDDQSATKLLNQSTRLMFEAIKMSTPTSLGDDKLIVNYGQRREAVVALQGAFNRISEENHETEVRDKVNQQLAGLVENADKLLQKGDNEKARVEIDKAYHLLKVTIESIRSGFATKEEEYHYEIDRNDTHSMLIRLLVDEKKKSDAMQQKVGEFVAEANLLRQQAEAFADKNAHEQAIELLEQSTRQLVRAIRSAGIYIPG